MPKKKAKKTTIQDMIGRKIYLSDSQVEAFWQGDRGKEGQNAPDSPEA